MAGNGVKSWVVPVLVAVVALAGLWYVAKPKAAPVASSDETKVEEFVPGDKRQTGTWTDKPHIWVAGGPLGEPDVTFDVEVARAEYKPSEFRVKKGQVVRFRLHAKDSGLADMPELQGKLGLEQFSGHGFEILGPYDVWITGLRKGVTKEVTIKATEAGEFSIECVVICSPDHYLMRGKFIVEE